MSLGVLNNLSAVYAENSLNNTNNSLNTVLQQLSSGSKINSGADDAAGLSLVNGLEANQTALTQSKTNASEGVGLLQVADGALSQVTSLLNRAVTLATEVSNGTLNSSQDAAANQEYQSILSEINNIGNTTTYNQNQVFNGAAAGVSIYTGDSSTQSASVDDLYFALSLRPMWATRAASWPTATAPTTRSSTCRITARLRQLMMPLPTLPPRSPSTIWRRGQAAPRLRGPHQLALAAPAAMPTPPRE